MVVKKSIKTQSFLEKLKLIELFDDKRNEFEETVIEIYREKKTILFFCLDLIWKPIKEKVRFVLVVDGGEMFILMRKDRCNLSSKNLRKIHMKVGLMWK